MMLKIKPLSALCCLLALVVLEKTACAQISHGPRQPGQEVVAELVTKPNKLIVRVASNGCTGKGSFRVDIQKQEGLTEKVPHYVVDIIRVAADQCKAIAEGGALITFDMEKDLGLTGDYTYSVANRILQDPRLIVNDTTVNNFRYYLEFEKKHVRLKNGRFKQGSTPDDFLNVVLDGHLIGDLDNNGTDDAVAVLASNTMGSGVFFELTALVADMESDVVRQTHSVILGDRIKVNAIGMESGQITLDLTVHKPEDPSCCPSQKIKKRFILIENRLVEVQ